MVRDAVMRQAGVLMRQEEDACHGVALLWRARASLLTRALVFCVCWGYVHPDEFFQSTEVAVADLMGTGADGQAAGSRQPADEWARPWEFAAAHAVRSVLWPAFVAHPQIFAGVWWRKGTRGALSLSGALVALLLARLTVACACLALADSCVLRLGRAVGAPRAWDHVYCWMWPVLVFCCRTFSNTGELLCLAALLHLVLHIDADARLTAAADAARAAGTATRVRSLMRYAAAGVILALGTWVRFTFPCFAIPAVLYILLLAHRPRSVAEVVQWRLVPLVVAAILVAGTLILADSWYYGGASGAFVVTPWRAFRYNAQTKNLAQHGLHPRVTHVLLNMPMLFGLRCFAVLPVMKRCLTVRGSTAAHPLLRLCAHTICLALAVLSVAPHQEPRFLLPLVIPVAVLTAAAASKRDADWARWRSWQPALDCALLLWFGLLHQGGVVPGLLRLNHDLTVTHGLAGNNTSEATTATRTRTGLCFYETYSPPPSLLLDAVATARPHSLYMYPMHGFSDQNSPCTRALADPGRDESEAVYLVSPLTTVSHCDEPPPAVSAFNDGEGWQQVWFHDVSTTAAAAAEAAEPAEAQTRCVVARLLWAEWPHVSGEVLPAGPAHNAVLRCLYPQWGPGSDRQRPVMSVVSSMSLAAWELAPPARVQCTSARF